MKFLDFWNGLYFWSIRSYFALRDPYGLVKGRGDFLFNHRFLFVCFVKLSFGPMRRGEERLELVTYAL